MVMGPHVRSYSVDTNLHDAVQDHVGWRVCLLQGEGGATRLMAVFLQLCVWQFASKGRKERRKHRKTRVFASSQQERATGI